MGWSCTAAAMKTFDAVFDNIPPENRTEVSNQWTERGKVYFAECCGLRKYPDGRICGSIYVMVSDGRCKRTQTFRIDPDGTLVRGPALWKRILGEPNPELADPFLGLSVYATANRERAGVLADPNSPRVYPPTQL